MFTEERCVSIAYLLLSYLPLCSDRVYCCMLREAHKYVRGPSSEKKSEEYMLTGSNPGNPTDQKN